MCQPLMLVLDALFQILLFHPLRWDCSSLYVDFTDVETESQRG